MNRKRVIAYCLEAVLLVFSTATHAAGQKTEPSEPAPPPPEIKAPEHPITENQIRTFFNVCHVVSLNRRLTHEKMELQRKQLPEWYLQHVWDEIEDAVDNIDLPEVALPVYQKYISQDDAAWFIKFLVTPQGQELTRLYFAEVVKAQSAGVAPLDARQKALAELANQEAGEIARILASMSTKEIQDIQTHTAHLEEMKMKFLVGQMQKETAQAIIAKQMELANSIVARHQEEMAKAREKYEASHVPDASSKTHQ